MNSELTIKRLKQIARSQLIGRYGTAIPAVIIIAGIQFIALLLADSGGSATIGSYLIRYVISLIIDLLTGILFFGRSMFFLKIARCEDVITLKDVWTGIKNNMDKAVMVQIPFTLVSLICTIPMVLMNLSLIPSFFENFRDSVLLLNGIQIVALLITKLYLGLSFYVLSDEPSLSVPDVWVRSAELMRNKKGRLILVCLSVLPLMILGALGLVIGLLWFECFYRTLISDFYLDAKGEEIITSPVKTGHAPSDYSI